jgi:hypothetical protein
MSKPVKRQALAEMFDTWVCGNPRVALSAER